MKETNQYQNIVCPQFITFQKIGSTYLTFIINNPCLLMRGPSRNIVNVVGSLTFIQLMDDVMFVYLGIHYLEVRK